VEQPTRRGKGWIQIALLAGFFFLIIAAYWTLKPLRTSTVVKAFGVAYYPLFREAVVLISPLMVLALGAASRVFSRERIVHVFLGVFIVSSWVFWVLFTFGASRPVQLAFYLFVDSYITFNVALFWAYLNDIYSPAEARRHYSLIGLGGLCGGIAGSSVSGWASQALGNHIILVFSVFLVPIFFIVKALGRLTRNPVDRPLVALAPEGPRVPLSTGAREVFRSPYLLAVLGIVVMYEVISTALEYQFSADASAVFARRDAMAAFQGKVFFAAQIGALVIQIVLTTFVHRRFGPTAGLVVLPAILLVGSAGFVAVPGLVAISVLIGSEAAFSYSINQTSKETLYLPLAAAARYRAKAFIDVFGTRAAKATGALLVLVYSLWLHPRGVSPRVLIGLNVVHLALWFLAIGVVARRLHGARRAAVQPVDRAAVQSVDRAVADPSLARTGSP
jgi:AAA family ATP:ADP antiporter